MTVTAARRLTGTYVLGPEKQKLSKLAKAITPDGCTPNESEFLRSLIRQGAAQLDAIRKANNGQEPHVSVKVTVEALPGS